MVNLYSTLICPFCGYSETMKMPEDSCQFFFECPSCKSLLKPKAGDCCVFCSYGDVPCPPVQNKKHCC
ncbi:MAG TPA: GDCCVxC domain-containing (seleno)protein [Bacteroidia bacterium]|nr:GDCCVxC domain-containing (seleno)protein [Bacteroidia bacterium]HRS58026.1 GDCCVxC domain-containing (seleno)protein [Bacteroidia bacterium]HRU68851.1 GDCCVxC domain-containing (seleno)protein [Bacteroidia bacterium]